MKAIVEGTVKYNGKYYYTGEEIDITEKTEFDRLSSMGMINSGKKKSSAKKPGVDFTKIKGVGQELAELFVKEGYKSFDDVVSAGAQALEEFPGIGEAKAESIIDSALELVEG